MAKYYSAWRQVADVFSPENPVYPRDVAPTNVDCPDCWDTGLCSECFGEQQGCAALCDKGRCHCQQEETDDEPE